MVLVLLLLLLTVGAWAQIISETLPALQQLKAQGLVRFIGITGLPLKALQYVLDRVPQGGALFRLHPLLPSCARSPPS